MFRRLLVPLIAGWLAATPALTLPVAAQTLTTKDGIVEGTALVRIGSSRRVLAPGTTPNSSAGTAAEANAEVNVFRADVARAGGVVARSFERTGWSLVKLPANTDTRTGIARLAAVLGPGNVVPNRVLRRTAVSRTVSRTAVTGQSLTPNDARYASQWHLPKISAPAAWARSTGSRDVIVAVIDSGADLTHPDLKDNLWTNSREIPNNGRDDDNNGYVDDVHGVDTVERDGTPQDEDEHGTHVAGLVGAVGNNGIGSSGVMWQVRVLPLRFLDATGDGSTADAVELLEYVMALKSRGENIRVTVNSFSGTDEDPALEAAFRAAGRAGMLSFCAAGNGDASGHPRNTDWTPEYPAASDEPSIISVGASDQSDNPTWFSNYGAQSVDLAAPGLDITSLGLYGGYARFSGTSMATPIAAGAAALLWSLQPNLTPARVKELLISTADPVASWSGKSVSGGRLNLARLIEVGAPLSPPAPLSRSLAGYAYRLDRSSGQNVPLAGVQISLDRNTVTYTNSQGFYSFSNLQIGTYSVKARLKNFAFRSARLYVRADSPAEMRYDFVSSSRRSYYTLSGRAVGPDGAGRGGIEIFQPGVPTALAVTDANGFYAIHDRGSGRYTLEARGAGLNWEATQTNVKLPTRGLLESPGARIDFGIRENNAPNLDLSAPSASVSSAIALSARGVASDDSGLTSVTLVLSRLDSRGRTQYFMWERNRWTSSSRSSSIFAILPMNGTSFNWSQPLPSEAGAYTLTIVARDIWNNQTTLTHAFSVGASSSASSIRSF